MSVGDTVRRVVVENIGILLTGDVARPRLDATRLTIEAGRIVAIGTEHADGPAAADVVVDARGNLVMPGLWDAHHYLYFGDYTPYFDARGSLEHMVRAGTTCVVAAGATGMPGEPRDAIGARYLAILLSRSWALDRPMNMRIHAGTVVASPGLTEPDFVSMAQAGVQRLAFLAPLPTADAARRLAGWARDQHMVVVAACGGPALIEAASSPREALELLAPDVAALVNGGPSPPTEDVVDWLVDETTCALGLVLDGSLQLTRRVVERVLRRGQPERLVLGSARPSPLGIAPAAIQRLAGVLSASCGVPPEIAIACGSGNTARAFGLPGGRLAVDQPADLVIGGVEQFADFRDPLAALEQGGWVAVSTVLIDGTPVVDGGGITGEPRTSARVSHG